MERLSYVLKPENLAVAISDPVSKMPVWKTMHSTHASFKSIVQRSSAKIGRRLFACSTRRN